MLSRIRLLPSLFISGVLLAQNVVVNPTGNQNIVQPVGTSTSINNLSNIRYVTPSYNWSFTLTSTITGGSPATVTLPAGMLGIDVSNSGVYFVYLVQGSTSEIQQVTGGTYTPASGGTIVFTPNNTYTSGGTVGSASTGIQEAINDGCGTGSTAADCHVILPPSGGISGAMKIRGTVFEHCARCIVEGYGTILQTYTRDRAWLLGSPTIGYPNVALRGVTFTSGVTQDGCLITNTVESGGTATITVVSGCSTIITGDTVNIAFTDSTAFWGEHGSVIVSGTTISYSHAGTVASEPSPGTIAIQNAAVEDDATELGLMENIDTYATGTNAYNEFFVINNDQSATIRNFNENNVPLVCTAHHCGSFVYSSGTTLAAPVIWIDKANISPQCGGNGVTVYANNSTRITDSVIEGFGMWAENTQTLLGSYQGTESDNVYMEEGAGPCTHPYNPGSGSVFSAAGIIWQSGIGPLHIHDGVQPGAHLPQFACTGTGCSGTTQYNYYVIANDTTSGVHSFPLFAGYTLTSGSGTISGQFPHVPPQDPGDTVTYDILRMVPAASVAANTPGFPARNACTGGSASACGSIITAQAQCSGLLCTFTDTASASTASYALPSTSWSVELPFWPAAILVNGNGGFGMASAIIADTEMSDVVDASNGQSYPRVFIRQCNFSDDGGFSGGALKSCAEFGTNGTGSYGATVIANNGLVGAQGRLNFINTAPLNNFGVNAGHIITLVNSIPSVALATYGFRPPASPNDTYIGLDAGGGYSFAQLAFGSPVAISNYIGNVGDNASYLERLTASLKTFNVPIKTPSATLALATTAIGANTCAAAQAVSLTGLTTSSVVKWSFASTPIGVTGYGTGGLQIATFATSGKANFVVCNITSGSITPGAISVNVREEQ